MVNTNGKYTPPFDNERFWKNIIYFSNYFGPTGIRKSSKYIIDVSKNCGVQEAIASVDCLEKISSVSVQDIYQNYFNTKAFQYSMEDLFKELANKIKVSVPDLIRFELKHSLNEYGELYDKEKFPRDKWIGKYRYEKLKDYTVWNDESKFEFEAAINKFSVDLLLYLKRGKIVEGRLFEDFISKLAETKEETGVAIAIRLLQPYENEKTIKWMKVLRFLNKTENYIIIHWQNSEEFVCKWGEEDAELVMQLISSNSAELFFQCDLVGSNRNGRYSSGEASRANFLLSMYDALKKVRENDRANDNKNIILLLDEIDAFYHPQYQINLVENILNIVSHTFNEYCVQIILTSNTPLEISDFPASNIIYLDNGRVNTRQNNINTFGNNVCSLMKNNFYIDSTMGSFARKKINEVIYMLRTKTAEEIDKENMQYLISIIGEPIIRNKLNAMYHDKFSEDVKSDFYTEGRLQEYWNNGSFNKKINNENLLKQLENEISKLTDILKLLKG